MRHAVPIQKSRNWWTSLHSLVQLPLKTAITTEFKTLCKVQSPGCFRENSLFNSQGQLPPFAQRATKNYISSWPMPLSLSPSFLQPIYYRPIAINGFRWLIVKWSSIICLSSWWCFFSLCSSWCPRSVKGLQKWPVPFGSISFLILLGGHGYPRYDWPTANHAEPEALRAINHDNPALTISQPS